MGYLAEKLKQQGAIEIENEDQGHYQEFEIDPDSWDSVLPLGLFEGMTGIPVLEKNKKTGGYQYKVPLEVLVIDSRGNKSERKTVKYFTLNDIGSKFWRQALDELQIKYTQNGTKIRFDDTQFNNLVCKVEVTENNKGYRNITLHNKDYQKEE